MDNRHRRLLWHGMLLFILGLMTGLFEEAFKNPRMGLAAHLEGLMNGTWKHVRLSPPMATLTFATALYGAYANWASTTFAAVFGTAAMTPLAAGAFKGQPWQELLVAFGLVSVGLATLSSSGLLLWSFRQGARDSSSIESGLR